MHSHLQSLNASYSALLLSPEGLRTLIITVSGALFPQCSKRYATQGFFEFSPFDNVIFHRSGLSFNFFFYWFRVNPAYIATAVVSECPNTHTFKGGRFYQLKDVYISSR